MQSIIPQIRFPHRSSRRSYDLIYIRTQPHITRHRYPETTSCDTLYARYTAAIIIVITIHLQLQMC